MEYRFAIADSFTPQTLPMERLAEYVAALAKLLGERENVHFRSIEAGSAVLVATIDTPAQRKVRDRVIAVRDGHAPRTSKEPSPIWTSCFARTMRQVSSATLQATWF
jgi:hypothetical protein